MKIQIILIVFILFFLSSIKGEDYKSFISNLGLNLEEITVVTEDRYILSIWELTSKDINNRNGKSIILQHGLLDGAFTWAILEEKSLAKLLCDEGYKVYLSNIRGSKFSKSHLDYDISLNSEFWDFSFDEIAEYDLTAIISLIKKRDNIIRRFKVQLMKNIHKFINNCFDVNSPKYANKISVIKKISPYYKSISKRENIKWFNSKIKDIFSQKLSNRIVTCDLDYNKKLIKKIYEKGKEQKVIKNLEKTIKEFWDIYIKDDNNIDFIGFETIKDDINKFRKSGETEEYIAKYIEIAKKYEEIFNDIIPREKKPKKDIDI